jgi:hypothetical protein
MRDIWYGDRRDRVKWSALVHLARAQQLSKIIQVAFYRVGKEHRLEVDESYVAVPQEVWDHFSLGKIQGLAEVFLSNENRAICLSKIGPLRWFHMNLDN